MTRSFHIALATVLFGALVTGCNTAPKTAADKKSLELTAQAALTKMKERNPELSTILSGAYGYAVFPRVSEGGFIVGAGYGRGEVYDQGQFVGYADITKVNVGALAGGQTFSELIVFQNKEAADRFKYGKLKFDAGVSAVALEAGVAAQANYANGVAVFTHVEGGLMVKAAIGGQEFSFEPAAKPQGDTLGGPAVAPTTEPVAFPTTVPTTP